MCGICGIYEYGASEPAITPGLIALMRDTMTHRGPDDAGVYVTPDRRVGLGHRRLSIIDLSTAGRNPMPSQDGRIWITFNGEIYNHESLRQPLIEKGYRYRSRTDTETVIHLYEEFGLEFVHRLDGFFALGLWDERRRTLVLVRDRIGKKPLYYCVAGGRLIFASEIKAILTHPAVPRDIDEEALYHYLTFLAAPAPSTLFAGINKLPPGFMLTCNERGDVRATCYWDAIAPAEPFEMNEEECAEEVRRLLSESIHKRMMSDVPFGVFLSGGIDSTAIVAMMSRMLDTPVRTFTVGFRDDPEYNELEYARDVSREYDTEHHEVIIGQQELLDSLPSMIFHQDEPIADPVCVPLFYVSELARQTGTKVVQVGEGSDELFCGYNDYKFYLELHNRLWRHLVRLPRSVRRMIELAGLGFFYGGGRRLLPKGRKMMPDLLRRIAEGEELFWSGAFVFDERNKHKLLSPAVVERLRRADHGRAPTSHSIVRADLGRLLAEKPDADQLDRMIYLDLKLRLAELLLMRVDKITMATSVEARVPFLDHKLVRFAVSMPSKMKYKDGETKYILKRALAGQIPDRVLKRQKKGFGAPISQWMLDRLGGFLEHSLFGSTLRQRELFDYDFIRRILKDHRSGRVDNSFFLWSLLNLSLWYDQWIENRPTADGSLPEGLAPEADTAVVEVPGRV